MNQVEHILRKFKHQLAGIPWHLVAAFFLLTVGIVSAGFFYSRDQKARIVQDTYQSLTLIADLKVDQIKNWREERLYDAETIFGNPLIPSLVERWFQSGDADPRLKKELLDWMESARKRKDYDGISIVDTEGNVRLTKSDTNIPFDVNEKSLVHEALQGRKIIFSDLYQEKEDGGEICIATIVPLILPEKKDSVPIGVLFVKIHADHFLFSLIKTWPTNSKTAETLLVRREGDDVVFLNDLRHRKDTALTLRVPISTEQLPAAMAARGAEGTVQGNDYRGVPVFAAIKRVPDTGWYVISKIDKSEIYGPIYEHEVTVTVLVVFMIAAVAMGVTFMWRKRNIRFYRAQEEALSKAYGELEIKVQERTQELVEANASLREEMIERWEAERYMHISNELLRLLGKTYERRQYLESSVGYLKEWSGCRCVGIRMLNEKGEIPYESYTGFSREFWESENWLLINRDQCACVRVIKGQPDEQELRFTTPGGSFRCDNTMKFADGLSDEERKRYRGVCIQSGFTSVAVIPIRSKDKIVGAIHLADEREEMVPLKMVKLVESLGALIGEGLQRLDMESDLINTQQQLAESKRLSDIGALAATVAHELRNPLGVMQTALYNIKRKVQDQSLDKHLANVEKKIAESSQIINNLLFYTRIKEPNYEKVALSELLSECMATATERFHDMNVEVEKKLGLIEGVMVDADSFQMKEVFNNILINAYQAVNGEDSRIEIDGKLCENRCVEIIIRDNGTGIEPQDLDRVFDPFFTRKSRGTGLGLAICRELVRLHKGEVRIESEKGKGTSVTVTLPIDA